MKKQIAIGLISLSLSLGSAGLSLADEMNGMNMLPDSQTHGTTPHAAASGMDPNMPGMGSGIPGMDHNAPDIDTNVEQSHGEQTHGVKAAAGQARGHAAKGGGSEGVNWTVVRGFLAANLLIIGTAGILKYTRKSQSQPQH